MDFVDLVDLLVFLIHLFLSSPSSRMIMSCFGNPVGLPGHSEDEYDGDDGDGEGGVTAAVRVD